MRQPFTVFIDFDDVLLNTPTLVKKSHAIFRRHGVSFADEEITYKQSQKKHGGFHRQYQLSLLKKLYPSLPLATTIARELDDAWKPVHKHVYPDARTFLTTVRKNGWRTELVTAGNPTWQQDKVKRSNLLPLLDGTNYVPHGKKKSAAISAHKKLPPHFVFVDDRADFVADVKRVFKERVLAVQLCRRRSQERSPKADIIRTNLQTALAAIKQFANKHGY